MKLQTILIGLCSLVSVTFCQYQHMMQMQHQGLQRVTPGSVLRPRSPVAVNRPRWPLATNQIPTLAQRPYKPLFMYMKGPPPLYRGQKPIVKYPNTYPTYWKNPLTYRPPVIKDMFRNPQLALLPNNHQIAVTPTSAQKLLATSSPVQNLIANVQAQPSANLQSGPLTKNYLASSISTNSFISGHFGQTSRPLAGPSTMATPSVAYPIRVDGEGGPIHTIPAPNLSLADKPIVVPDYQNYIEDHSNKIKSGHTYEVTEETNDHKDYRQHPSSNNNLFFTDTDSLSTTRLSPSNYFSSLSQQSVIPQASALRAQPVAPTLTSEELFALLNGAAPQQSPETYAFSSLSQPQFHQFIHQPFEQMKPIQPFNAVIQPAHAPVNSPNVLFKPDPKYMEKIQEQISKQQSIVQPTYHNFNYQEPTRDVANNYSAEKFKAEIQKMLQDDINLNSVHYNVVRSTKESIPQTSSLNVQQNISNSNLIQDSETEASYNVGSKINFMPQNEDNVASDISEIDPAYLTEIDNIASSSISPAYYNSFPNKNAEDTLATLQAAGNLINIAQNKKNFKAIPENYFSNMNEYYNENDQKYRNEFTPMQVSSLQINNDNANGQAPIRIFVPEDYEDITQPTENIKVSASMNTDERQKNGMTITFDNEDIGSSGLQQYDDISQVSERENNNTYSDLESILNSFNNPPENKRNSDIVVTMQQNLTNPTLDILTKDWETSIVIKPTKNSEKNKMDPELNQINEFGNRIRPKRE